MKKLAILIILILNLPIVVLAQDAPPTLGDCYETNQCEDKPTNRETRQCKQACKLELTEEEGLSGQELIDSLTPSQNDLFGVGSDVKLATGDLEQGLAPRILNILVSFSSVLALILFTYLGVRLVVARSNEEEFTKLKRALVNSLVGVVIIAAAFGLVIGVLRIFDKI